MMNDHDRLPFDREIAELLQGAPSASRDAGHLAERLAQRLAAAASPALPSELAREEMAVAAFRSAAGVTLASQPGRPPMLKTALAKMLTLKAAAVLLAVSAGSVAVAATTGILPNPLSSDSPAPSHSTPGSGNPGQGTPSPSLRGLCTAFLAGAGSDHGKALENPAFTALITAAGGKDKVDSYCATLLATAPGNAPTSHPGGEPTTHPGDAPTEHATGQPTTHPGGAPTATESRGGS